MCFIKECKNQHRPSRTLCEYHSVQSLVSSHRRAIQKGHSTYAGMPFYDGWNPKCGGATTVGADWIMKNLGWPGEGYQLHIIDRKIGFVPGNLMWVPIDRHKSEEMIAKQALQIQALEKLIDGLA
jgi:hypothetical protein